MRCESCGHEFTGTYGAACPACGTVAANPFETGEPASGPSPWAAPRTTSNAADGRSETTDGIPWENAQSAQSLFETIKGVLLESNSTFAGASRTTGIGPAFIYVLVLGTAGGIIGQLWGLATGSVIGKVMGSSSGMDGIEGLGALATSSVVGFITVPVSVVISVFVVAGVVHLVLMMAGGANAGFEATFRVVAFAQGSTALLQVVPVVGLLAALVWEIVAAIIGLRELHGTTTGKAATAALVPLAVACCCVLATIGSMAGAIASATHGL